MALVTCKDCSRSISSSARACPNCGAPLVNQPQKMSKTSRLSWLLLFVGAPVFIVSMMIGLYEPQGNPRQVQSPKVSALTTPPQPTVKPSEEKPSAMLSELAEEHKGEQWTISESRDEMTEKMSTFLTVPANGFAINSIGKRTVPKLLVACVDSTTTIGVSIDNAFFTETNINVLVKVDAEAAYTDPWQASHGVAIADKSIALIRKIENAELLKLRVPVYQSGNQDLSFTVYGLNLHLPAIRKACSWS